MIDFASQTASRSEVADDVACVSGYDAELPFHLCRSRQHRDARGQAFLFAGCGLFRARISRRRTRVFFTFSIDFEAFVATHHEEHSGYGTINRLAVSRSRRSPCSARLPDHAAISTMVLPAHTYVTASPS